MSPMLAEIRIPTLDLEEEVEGGGAEEDGGEGSSGPKHRERGTFPLPEKNCELVGGQRRTWVFRILRVCIVSNQESLVVGTKEAGLSLFLTRDRMTTSVPGGMYLAEKIDVSLHHLMKIVKTILLKKTSLEIL